MSTCRLGLLTRLPFNMWARWWGGSWGQVGIKKLWGTNLLHVPPQLNNCKCASPKYTGEDILSSMSCFVLFCIFTSHLDQPMYICTYSTWFCALMYILYISRLRWTRAPRWRDPWSHSFIQPPMVFFKQESTVCETHGLMVSIHNGVFYLLTPPFVCFYPSNPQ